MAALLTELPILGVNVDHVATLRQARGTSYPDPVDAAFIAERAGAGQITIHLREDRRHIIDRDVELMRQTIKTRLNLEMGATDEMIAIALRTRPHMVTLVPERREERTTEGGLDVAGALPALSNCIAHLQQAGIIVSHFIDPDPRQIAAAVESGAPMIELHTGEYASATDNERPEQLQLLHTASRLAHEAGLRVAAGHGLHYHNTRLLVARIPWIEEYNIGHAIVSRAVLEGMDRAVRDMVEILHAGVALR
jgi:pyridoxine 5-phosphate synthase